MSAEEGSGVRGGEVEGERAVGETAKSKGSGLQRTNSLDAAKAEVSQAFKELRQGQGTTGQEGEEGAVLSSKLQKIEEKVELAFVSVSDWLSEELHHQKAHLVLMQNQLDKQQQANLKQQQELKKLIEMEKAQRVLAQRSQREQKEVLQDNMATLADGMEQFEERIFSLELPWWKKWCIGARGTYHELSSQRYRPIK